MDFWILASEAESAEQAVAIRKIPEDIHDAMITEIGRGEYAPINATTFVTEFIRRVTEAQGTP